MSLASGELIAGQFVVERRWSPRDLYSGYRQLDSRAVLISYVPRCAIAVPELQAQLGFSIQGVTPLIFLGGVDRFPPRASDAPEVVLVEAMPDGTALASCPLPLAPGAVISVGQGLCVTALSARSERRYLEGAAPDLTFCEPDGARWRLTALAPRSLAFLATPQRKHGTTLDGPNAFADPDLYVAPELGEGVVDPDRSNAYLVGLLIAFAATGRHPFAKLDGENDQFTLMTMDRRLPLDVPPALDRLLSAVLVADPARRIGLDELAAGLGALASRTSEGGQP